MRLFAKVFLCTTLVSTLALSLSGYLLIASSYSDALKRETERALDEYQYTKFSVQSALITGVDNLEHTLALTQHAQAALFTGDGAPVFSALPPGFPPGIPALASPDEVRYHIEHIDRSRYAVVYGQLHQAGKEMTLVVASDISAISQQRAAMIRSFARVYLLTLAASMLLTSVLAALLVQPIKGLTRASEWMADGHYQARLPAAGGDEIGELSVSFNAMAHAVQSKIDQLSTSARQREDFIASLTHELKTPLTSVIGYADMMYQKDMSREDVRRAARCIVDEGLRLEALSVKLMDLVVLNHDDFVLEEMLADELLHDMAETLEPMCRQRGAELRACADAAYIRVDYDLFKTLLANLIDNSIKAGSTLIQVSGKRRGGHYHVSVADNGGGIPPADIERVTEAFYVVDKSRSRQAHGAGLGLALASRIAAIHGAALEFASEEGRGTCVEMRLPCDEEDARE